jgi:hypothetical protein
VQSQDALPAALRLLPLTVGLVVVAPLAGRWAAARGPRAPVVTGLLLAAAGLALVALRLRDDLGDAELAALLGRVRRPGSACRRLRSSRPPSTR